MSPSFYTLHPAALFFNDCGLGSDPNATGPCTGGYGPAGDPAQLGQSVTSQIASGHGGILAVGLAFLALIALLSLIRRTRKAAGAVDGGKADKTEQPSAAAADVPGEVDEEDLDALDAAYYETMQSLEPGEGYCHACQARFERVDPDDFGVCPVCGMGEDQEPDDVDRGLDDEVEAARRAGLPECAICGEAVDEGEGRESFAGFVHHECEARREREADQAGYDDEPGR